MGKDGGSMRAATSAFPLLAETSVAERDVRKASRTERGSPDRTQAAGQHASPAHAGGSLSGPIGRNSPPRQFVQGLDDGRSPAGHDWPAAA